MTKDAKDRLEDLLDDLLQRKVDTIVTGGITGRAMPHPVSALVDINNAYLRKLRELGLATKQTEQTIPVKAKDDNAWLKGNSAAMEWLRTTAAVALHDPSLSGTHQAVVRRIVQTCSSLLRLVARLEREYPTLDFTELDTKQQPPAVELTRRERIALSKAWELSTDTVAMQTIAMLDGDIITRVAAEYADDSHGIVRQMHREAVAISFETWELLIGIVSNFAGALFVRRS